MLALFQLHAVRHVSKPAAVNFTPRMGLLASVQLWNTIRCGDFVVFSADSIRGSRRYVIAQIAE